MSKSTLSIFLKGGGFTIDRHVEVPCRLPDDFNFKFAGKTFTALLSGSSWTDVFVSSVECDEEEGIVLDALSTAERAEAILATIKAALGITGPVPPGSPLPAIALAYEAEVAAYEACVKAHAALPRELHSPALIKAHPGDRDYRYKGDAALLLAKYVEHVVQNAAAQVVP